MTLWRLGKIKSQRNTDQSLLLFCFMWHTGSQPYEDCVLHSVDKFYQFVQSDTVVGVSLQRLRMVPVSY